MASTTERGRLTEREMRVLIALAEGPRHGYGVMKEIERSTGGRIRVGSGSLYAILDKLSARGLIEESDRREDAPKKDERRRYVRLTDRGREAAAAEVRRLEEVAREARGVGLGPEETQGRAGKRRHILGLDEEPVRAGAPDASEKLDDYVYGSS